MDIHSVDQATAYRLRSLIFLDLETTGLNVQKHEILEIGAIRVNPKKPFKIEEELSLKVKATHLENADKEALRIVGYSNESWKRAISIKKALKMLEHFSRNGVMAGFNVSFDWAYLHKAYAEIGKEEPFHYHRLDVLSMAYVKLFNNKTINKFSLSTICDLLTVPRGDKHQALADAKATYLVFKKLIGLN